MAVPFILEAFLRPEPDCGSQTAEAAYPCWAPFVSNRAAPRSPDESAALLKTDIDWQRGLIHVESIQGQMGHASVQLPADTYGHLLPDRLRAASGALDLFLGRTRNARDDPDCATIRNPQRNRGTSGRLMP